MPGRIQWILARLRRMSPREIVWRGQQFARSKQDWIRPKKTATSMKAKEILEILPPLAQSMPITYFKAHLEWRGGEIPWQDPVAMVSQARHHWSDINYRDTAQHGDPKLVWELSRHQFLRHWVARQDIELSERVNAVSHLILNWVEKNPVGYGLNWCSSLEIALRLISWETAVESLGDENFHIRVMRVIHRSTVEHAAHLRRYPSLFSSNNNHRIGELLGEMAAAALFPDEDLLTAAWNAWHGIQAEARNQVSADGVNREQAMYYHAYVMLFLKRAARYAEQLAFPVPIEFRQMLDRMQHFLNTSTDTYGNWFEIGDRDDGDLQALLPWSSIAEPVSSPAIDGSWPFKDGGYWIWKAGKFHLLFRGGRFGYPSIGAHAHADQLSILLKLNGTDLLTDSGTCTYHDQEKWRRYFRGTSAHNTVRVNNADQAHYAGPFLWETAPEATLSFDTASDTVLGSTCYSTPSGEVCHQRQVNADKVGPVFLSVTDEIRYTTAPGKMEAELIWNLGPHYFATILTERCTDTTGVFSISDHKEIRLLLHVTSDSAYRVQVYHGDENLPAGFYSRQFGERTPITQIRIASIGTSLQYQSTFTVEETH